MRKSSMTGWLPRRRLLVAGASAATFGLAGCVGTFGTSQASDQPRAALDTPLSDLLLIFVSDRGYIQSIDNKRIPNVVLEHVWTIQDVLAKGVPTRFPQFARLNGFTAEAMAVPSPALLPKTPNRNVVKIHIQESSSTIRGAVWVRFGISVDQQGPIGTEPKPVWKGRISARPGDQGTFAGRPDGQYGPSYVDDFCAELLTILAEAGVVRLSDQRVKFPADSNHRDFY